MKDKKILIFFTIISIILFIFFFSTRHDKIIISNKKLKNNYIKIYKDDKYEILSKFLEINYSTKNDKIYTFNEALNNNITTIEKMIKKSSYNKTNEDGTIIYYFLKNSSLVSNNTFKMVFCNNGIIYIIDEFDIENNICKNS